MQDFRQWSSRVKGEMGKEFGIPVGNKTREKLSLCVWGPWGGLVR